MKPEEQMRIITNWTHKFNILPNGVGRQYGRVVLTPYHVMKFVGPYIERDRVVKESYKAVQKAVWDIVAQCGE